MEQHTDQKMMHSNTGLTYDRNYISRKTLWNSN